MRAKSELAQHDGYLSCCRFIDPNTIITSSGDSTCILWDVEQQKATKVFNDHSGDVMSVCINPKNTKMFVSGSCDSSAKVWNMEEASSDGSGVPGRCTYTFDGHDSDINSVDFFPDGQAFGTGSDDSTCRLFDMRCYQQLAKFDDQKILGQQPNAG